MNKAFSLARVVLVLWCVCSTGLVFAEDCSVRGGNIADCYRPRSEAILNVALVHYGKTMTEADLKRAGALFQKRFESATQNLLKLNIVDYRAIPMQISSQLPSPLKLLPSGSDEKRKIDRLIRLWYYENKSYEVSTEVFNAYQSSTPESISSNVDLLVVASEGQFPGIGFQTRRVAITEQPEEIAWGVEGGGKTEIQSDARLVDEWLHEVGHFLGMGHAATHCGVFPYLEQMKCCDETPNGKDVMSYCRSRDRVDSKFFYSYQACNLKILKEKTIPALMNGAAFIPQEDICE